MKSDKDNPVKALKGAVGKSLGERVIPENPPKGESQSDVRVEDAGKKIKGFVRLRKDKAETEAALQVRGKGQYSRMVA